MVKKRFSESFSLAGWDLLTYIKDRRKGVVALLAAGIAYAVSDNELAAILAGLVFEGLISVAEFYLKRIEL